MLILILIAVIASVFHVLTDIGDVKSKLEVAGKTFSLKEHVQRNYVAWLSTAFGITVMVLLNYHFKSDIPSTLSFRMFMAIFYLAGGYGGSGFFTKAFSTSQQRVSEVINNAIKDKVDIK